MSLFIFYFYEIFTFFFKTLHLSDSQYFPFHPETFTAANALWDGRKKKTFPDEVKPKILCSTAVRYSSLVPALSKWRAKFKSSLELSLIHFQRNFIPAVPLLWKQTCVKVKYVVHSPWEASYITGETALVVRQKYLLQAKKLQFEGMRLWVNNFHAPGCWGRGGAGIHRFWMVSVRG